MRPSYLRILGFGAAALGILGCSKSDPADVRRIDAPPAGAEAEVPIQPKLTELVVEEPQIKFESHEAEIEYWQKRTMEEVRKKFEKLTDAEIQKMFEQLDPHQQASVLRVRSWLPHKRIMEMGNPTQDVVTITSFPTQFDVELALQRLAEYADDSGVAVLMKNLGITSPKLIVPFRMEFGQIPPELQSLVWGIHQKLREGGIAQLAPAERSLLQDHPRLFPRLR